MAQPKDPPVSFRPGAERLERIEAWAKSRNLSRHLAILTLLDAGLRAVTAPEVTMVKPQSDREKIEGKGGRPEPFKTRLKGEWKAP